MALTCGFFNSENGDRKYNAEQMSAIFDGIIADGVFTTIGDHMAVSAGTGMQVLVGTGKAWFDHTWNVNDAAYPLAIAASDVTLSRIDAIVLETNHSDSVRLNKLRVVQGTAASSPVKPTLTNSEKVHQHPLAWVTVKPGVTQIAASTIENAVGTSACPFVTGIIATTAIDDLFNQWNGEFDEWFDNLKAQLSDNVVTNLQNQIDARVKIADKATSDDIYNGTDDSKWVTAKGLTGSETAYQIGDIKTRVRTDLGDRWLLCNGSMLDGSKYPILSSKIPVNPSLWHTTSNVGKLITSSRYGDITSPHIHKFNDLYVVAGGGDRIYFATSIEGPWSVVNPNLPSSPIQSTDYYYYIVDICYYNGLFVLLACYHCDRQRFYATYTSTNLYNWTAKQTFNINNVLNGGYDRSTIRGIKVIDDRFIIYGVRANSESNIPFIGYATSSEVNAGTWNIQTFGSPTSGVGGIIQIGDIVKTIDGKYLIAGNFSINNVQCNYAYSNSILGAWTGHSISGVQRTLNVISYDGNRYYLTCDYNQEYIYYTTNITSGWTKNSKNYMSTKEILYLHGYYYVATSTGNMTVCTDPLNYDSSAIYKIETLYSILNPVVIDNSVIGVKADSSTWMQSLQLNAVVLPTITPTNAYAYIRGK